jgi:hypothetical protein
MDNEGDRWFRISQDRRREKAVVARRARKRAAEAIRRAAQLDRAFAQSPSIKMERTEWTYDELGNLSRVIYSR